MKKQDLIKAIATAAGLSQDAAAKSVNAFIDVVTSVDSISTTYVRSIFFFFFFFSFCFIACGIFLFFLVIFLFLKERQVEYGKEIRQGGE